MLPVLHNMIRYTHFVTLVIKSHTALIHRYGLPFVADLAEVGGGGGVAPLV